jgi:hypothetical protein
VKHVLSALATWVLVLALGLVGFSSSWSPDRAGMPSAWALTDTRRAEDPNQTLTYYLIDEGSDMELIFLLSSHLPALTVQIDTQEEEHDWQLLLSLAETRESNLNIVDLRSFRT